MRLTTRASSNSLLALFFAVVLLLLQGSAVNAGCTKVSLLVTTIAFRRIFSLVR